MHKGLFRRKILRSKWFAIAVIAILALGLAIWVYAYNQSPAIGTIYTDTTNVLGVQQPSSKPTTQHFSGEVVAFDYPSEYDNFQAKPASMPTMEVYSFTFHEVSQQTCRIVVTVKQAASGESAMDDSAYAYRKLHPELYDASVVTVSGKQLQRAVKKDGSEITYFVPGPSGYAIVSGTSTNPDGRLAEDVLLTVTSLNWL